MPQAPHHTVASEDTFTVSMILVGVVRTKTNDIDDGSAFTLSPFESDFTIGGTIPPRVVSPLLFATAKKRCKKRYMVFFHSSAPSQSMWDAALVTHSIHNLHGSYIRM